MAYRGQRIGVGVRERHHAARIGAAGSKGGAWVVVRAGEVQVRRRRPVRDVEDVGVGGAVAGQSDLGRRRARACSGGESGGLLVQAIVRVEDGGDERCAHVHGAFREVQDAGDRCDAGVVLIGVLVGEHGAVEAVYDAPVPV